LADVTSRRLLWNSPAVVGCAAFALLLTIGIHEAQSFLRVGQLDPTAVPIFYRLFIFEDYPLAFACMAALLVALVPAVQNAALRLATAMGTRPGTVAAITTAGLALGSVVGYRSQPLSMDEAAPYMQAAIFASGRLTGQYPPSLLDWLVYPPFQDYFIHVSHVSGEIASAYWPGFALLLTPFALLGVPWLCNPLLGGAAVWVVHALTRSLTGSPMAAGGATLFAVGSVAFTVNAVSFYSMTAHLLCNGLFALCLMQRTPLGALLAGCAGGLALTLHNPVPHMLFAAPWLVWTAVQKDRLRQIVAMAAGYLPWIIVVGFGWHALLQSLEAVGPARAGTSGIVDSAISTIKGVLRLPGRTLLQDRAIGFAKLWLWAAPMLVVMSIYGAWIWRRATLAGLLVASAILTLLGYLFVPLSQGHGWGFRYFHSAWLVLPVLAGAALARPGEGRIDLSEPNQLGKYSLAAALLALVCITPLVLWQVRSFMDAHVAQLPDAPAGTPRVLIISPSSGYYSQDLVQNDPFLRNEVVRMVTQGRAADAKMMRLEFPEYVMLAKTHKGTVWGYGPSAASTPPSTAGAGRALR
jgi:hypothetical protein